MTSQPALDALMSLPLFRNTSVRLLADLAASTRTQRLGGGDGSAVLAALLDGIVDGRVRAEEEEPVVASHRAWGAQLALSREPGSRPSGPRPVDAGAWLRRPNDLVERLQASPLLLRSLAAPVVDAVADAPWRPRLHSVWVTAEAGLDVPLEAMTLLLGAALASQFGEATAVGVLGDGGVDLWLWNGPDLVAEPLPKQRTLHASIHYLLQTRDLPFAHLLVVHPERPRELPPRFGRRRFDRVVFVTRNAVDAVPELGRGLLRSGVLCDAEPAEAFFSAFVATRLLPLPDDQRRLELRTELAGGAGSPAAPGHRLRRDACRLRLDVGALERRWREWRRPAGAFPSLLVSDPALRATMERWARAITNRRVGVALSGGGASVYRMVPVLEALADAGVPVDIVSGISGGALLGAYYCTFGLSGLRRCIERGPLLQLGVLLSVLDMGAVQRFLDYDLGHTSLDDLEVMFLPVTTALRPGAPPEPHVVTGGSLGRAVRASGAAPVIFAPTEVNGTRFADGAISTPVPAQILAEYGADMVIACNCIPGPEDRNPFSRWRMGEMVYRWTPLGRLIDLWVATSALVQRVSREAGQQAHAFVETGTTRVPLVESFQFAAAARIADDAAKDADLAAKVSRCAARWREFAWRAEP